MMGSRREVDMLPFYFVVLGKMRVVEVGYDSPERRRAVQCFCSCEPAILRRAAQDLADAVGGKVVECILMEHHRDILLSVEKWLRRKGSTIYANSFHDEFIDMTESTDGDIDTTESTDEADE